MGCGQSSANGTEVNENSKNEVPKNNKRNKNRKKVSNTKVIVTEDPEKQGEKYHMSDSEDDAKKIKPTSNKNIKKTENNEEDDNIDNQGEKKNKGDDASSFDF